MLAENVYEMINWPATPLLHPHFLSRLHLPYLHLRTSFK